MSAVVLKLWVKYVREDFNKINNILFSLALHTYSRMCQFSQMGFLNNKQQT